MRANTRSDLRFLFQISTPVIDNITVASPVMQITIRPGRPRTWPECSGNCQARNLSAGVPLP